MYTCIYGDNNYLLPMEKVRTGHNINIDLKKQHVRV